MTTLQEFIEQQKANPWPKPDSQKPSELITAAIAASRELMKYNVGVSWGLAGSHLDDVVYRGSKPHGLLPWGGARRALW